MRRRAFVQLSGLAGIYAGAAVVPTTALAVLSGCTTGSPPVPGGRPDDGAPHGPLAEDLAVGDGQRVFAADGTSAGLTPLGHRVDLYASSGARIASIGDPARAGSGDVGTLNAPIAAVWGARLFVLEKGNARIQAFSAIGTSHGVVARTSLRPSDLALDPGGYFYVAVPSAHRIEVFAPNGAAVRTIGRFGTGPDGLNGPRSVALGSDGLLHIVDTGSARIKVLSRDGRHVRSYGDVGGDARLVGPSAIRFDGEGRAWVADLLGGAIRVYDPNGTFLERITPRMPDGRRGAPTTLTMRADGTIYAAILAMG